jgi:hypothetical protein
MDSFLKLDIIWTLKTNYYTCLIWGYLEQLIRLWNFKLRYPKIDRFLHEKKKCVLADFLNQLSVGGRVSLGWSGTNSWELSRPKFVAAQ